MTWPASACCVVSTYVIFIWVCKILMACESLTTYLLTGLPHAGLYNYNGRQIELFHMKWFVDRLTGTRLMSLWNAWGWC